MTKKFDLKPTLVLSVICVVMVALLAVVNMITAPIIAAKQNAAANEALLEVLPDGKNFEEIDLGTYTLPASIQKAWKADGGYVIQSMVKGYKDGLIIMCGIDSEGKIAGAKYIQSNETLGAENGLGDRFVGHSVDTMTIDIVAGPTATQTTHAYYKAIEDSLNAAIILGGGTADIRDPEQIFQDTMNEILGTEGETFTRWFMVEEIDGFEDIYISTAGLVLKVRDEESYVAVKDGAVVGEHDEELKTKALTASEVYASSTISEITERPAGLSTEILKVSVTGSGNYLFEVYAKGYGSFGKYSASGEKILIKISVTSDGTIIDIETLYQSETPGVGSVCGDAEWYENFIGKYCEVTEVDGYYAINGEKTTVEVSADGATVTVKNNKGKGTFILNGVDTGIMAYGVDNIAKATVTSAGYKNAVHLAVSSVELLKGGQIDEE